MSGYSVLPCRLPLNPKLVTSNCKNNTPIHYCITNNGTEIICIHSQARSSHGSRFCLFCFCTPSQRLSQVSIKFNQYRSLYTYRGIVTHFVWMSWDEIAFSSSSNPPVFFSFFTRLFTAFSDHRSSVSSFFHPSNRFTIGGVNVRRLLIFHGRSSDKPGEYQPLCLQP